MPLNRVRLHGSLSVTARVSTGIAGRTAISSTAAAAAPCSASVGNSSLFSHVWGPRLSHVCRCGRSLAAGDSASGKASYLRGWNQVGMVGRSSRKGCQASIARRSSLCFSTVNPIHFPAALAWSLQRSAVQRSAVAVEQQPAILDKCFHSSSFPLLACV